MASAVHFALVLTCWWVVPLAWSVHVPADLGLHLSPSMRKSTRLFLNPFSILGNPTCTYNEDEGMCYGEIECLALAGTYGNFCSGLHGLCCLFYRTCNQRTSQMVSYFSNAQYPLVDRPGTSCSFLVVKRSSDICGIGVEMKEADFPGKRYNRCTDMFHVTGIRNNQLEPKCSTLTGKKFTYDVSRVEEIMIHVNSTTSDSLKWKMKVTQILCTEFTGENLDGIDSSSGSGSGGSGGSGGGSGGSGGSGGGSGGSGGGSGGSGGSGGGSGGSGVGSGGSGGGSGGSGGGSGGSGGGSGGSGGGSGGSGGGSGGSGGGSGGSGGGSGSSGGGSGGSSGSGGGSGGSGGSGGGSGGSGGSGGGSGSSTTEYPIVPSPPAPPPITTTESPSTFLRCGIKGPSFYQGIRNQGTDQRFRSLGPRGPDVVSISARRKGGNRRRGSIGHKSGSSNHRQSSVKEEDDTRVRQGTVFGSVASTAPVTSDEWRVPDLSNTLFAHYAGERNIFSTRITYGSVAGLMEFPWQVAMIVNGRYHCGGSLIGLRWVLSAAHCAKPFEKTPEDVMLSMGDWNLKTLTDGPSVNATVDQIFVHELYSRHTLQYDLALLRLSSEIPLSDDIQPICLPPPDLEAEGMVATVTGWGRNEKQKLQAELHHLSALIINDTICDERWRAQGAAKGFIVSSMLCMDATNGDSCNGDSGGPSIVEYPSGSKKYTQVGVVSFGSGSCTEADLPGVYTEVRYFLQWIQDRMK